MDKDSPAARASFYAPEAYLAGEAVNAYEPKRGPCDKGERKNVSIELVPRAQSGWAAVMGRGPRKFESGARSLRL